jgi:hypothetical protein
MSYMMTMRRSSKIEKDLEWSKAIVETIVHHSTLVIATQHNDDNSKVFQWFRGLGGC